MKAISVSHINKQFGDFKAVDDVSFEVPEGTLAALLGPSGSGKSTILRIIAGLEKPDKGHIYLKGQEVTGHRTQQRNIGFVFQHYALFKHMTVEKNIAFGLDIRKSMPKTEIKDRVDQLIDLVKLNGYANHYPSQLSGGQRQRVALARALAPEPKVLLLDEPFGALDAKVRKNLAQWIRSLHDRIKVTSIFVTHDQNEAMEIADQLVLVNRGKIEQIGSAHEIYESPATKFAASFVGNVNVIEAFIRKGNIFINQSKVKIGGNGNGTPHEPPSPDGEAVLLVRPEDVSIGRENKLDETVEGRIESIHYRGNIYELDIFIDKQGIKCLMDKEQFQNNQWQEQEKVFVNFRRYKTFDAGEGYDQIQDMLRQYGYIE